MDINEFIEHFVEQFDEAPTTRHHEMDEWTSLIALSVMAMIDEEYDVQIKADEMRNSQTVQELFDIVQSYLNK